MSRSLKTYSDAGCTTRAEVFEIGDVVYINGSITSLLATSGSTVKLQVCRSSNDSVIETPLNNEDFDFPANTVQSIKTHVNGGTAPNFTLDKGTYFHEKYYIKLTVSGDDLDDTYDETEFRIPLAQITQGYIWGVDTDDTTKKHYWGKDETMNINGAVRLDQAVDGVTVQVSISVPSGSSTIFTTTHDFAKDTIYTLKEINGDASVTADLAALAGGEGEYILWLSVTKADYVLVHSSGNYFFVSIETPTITSPTISDTAIKQDESVVIAGTCYSITDRVIVIFKDSSGNVVYACDLPKVTSTTFSGRTTPMRIPVDEYGAGDIEVIALNVDGTTSVIRGAIDDTLTLTVSAVSGLGAGRISRMLTQEVTIYPFSAYDDFAEESWGGGVGVACRIVQDNQRITDAEGHDHVSSTQIYISGEKSVSVEDKIELPDGTTPVILHVKAVPKIGGAAGIKVIYT